MNGPEREDPEREDPGGGTGAPPAGESAEGTASGGQLLRELLAASHLCPMEGLPDLVRGRAERAGLRGVTIYVADLQEELLRPLEGGIEGGPPDLRVEGTLAGRAFQSLEMLSSGGEGGWWVPLLDGTERLGVLWVDAGAADERTRQDIRHLASMVALMLISKRAYSDFYNRLVRTRPMHIAAEMSWNLAPPLTFATGDLVIGGVLEPAYEIAGDAFDYGLSGDVVRLAVFDAMGHDTSAGLTANLAVAAFRHSRRLGTGLAETSETIERVLIQEFGRAQRFATAILATLHIPSGVLTWVNRGHPPPVLIRGGRWKTTLSCPPAHPLGLDLGLPVRSCREQLEPGDRVLLYTDGITEARSAAGEEFGLDRFTDLVIRHHAAGMPVPETLRRLVRDLLAYHDDRLQDDATVLLVEWRGAGHRRLLR
ncbi:hypothetical protein Misp01_43580 [Microtetraspora sp. NBRC 13810]|uniref:PP2C family protein-serine/threonine phosphatase n=1 Tax=Microtetraspora sp. NBRC 13810 TaxID=3030990 RepID=UPI00249FAA71|nr:PP2C family protein-serine/threonine phosphatase [Microtetraspora sp. NBRC 13810]GLW09229.1 hypothetical protein Misp01_43580 [Microtetraspora sp. NBRC 13810]